MQRTLILLVCIVKNTVETAENYCNPETSFHSVFSKVCPRMNESLTFINLEDFVGDL